MRYINELKSGDMISDIYLCKTKQTLKTKAGKSYYSMMLQDKTGTVDAKAVSYTHLDVYKRQVICCPEWSYCKGQNLYHLCSSAG